MAKQAKRQLAGSGEALPVGVIGEVVTSAVVEIGGTSSVGATYGTLPLTRGVWLVTFSGALINSLGTISNAAWSIIFTTNQAQNPSVNDYFFNISNACGGAAGFETTNAPKHHASTTLTIVITADTTYYLRGAFSSTGGGSVGLRGVARAVRIA
jgi:hypothetical protein